MEWTLRLNDKWTWASVYANSYHRSERFTNTNPNKTAYTYIVSSHIRKSSSVKCTNTFVNRITQWKKEVIDFFFVDLYRICSQQVSDCFQCALKITHNLWLLSVSFLDVCADASFLFLYERTFQVRQKRKKCEQSPTNNFWPHSIYFVYKNNKFIFAFFCTVYAFVYAVLFDLHSIRCCIKAFSRRNFSYCYVSMPTFTQHLIWKCRSLNLP